MKRPRWFERDKKTGGSAPQPEYKEARLGGLGLGLTAALVVTLLAMAAIFSIANGTEEIANVGTEGVYAEATLSAAAATRNRSVQAQVISEAFVLDLATEDEFATSLGKVVEAKVELERRADALLEETDDAARAEILAAQSAALIGTVEEVVELIRTGQSVDADELIQSSLEADYQAYAGNLAAIRDDAVRRIEFAREDAGRLADATRFLVTLFAPLGLILAYRRRLKKEGERKDLARELEKQRAVSESKDELIANLSHELRTPLTSIYGFAHELTEISDRESPAMTRELAGLIAADSADLSRMVEDLLTAATVDQGALVISIEQVDPSADIEEVLTSFATAGHRIQADVEPGVIEADRLRLRQIVRNLVSNAVRHGGADIRLNGRVDDDRYIIEVLDNGPGVPSELEDRLFTRFIHEGDTPLLTGSVGLGLSIASMLSDKIGATLRYRRKDGWTTFEVAFDLVESDAATASALATEPYPSTELGVRAAAFVSQIDDLD